MQPAVVLYGRRWHTATDTIPFPAFFAAIAHAVWLIVFGWLISVYDIWKTTCHGQGLHYKVVSGSLAAIYGLSILVEAGLTGLGLRGRPTPCFLSDTNADGGLFCCSTTKESFGQLAVVLGL